MIPWKRLDRSKPKKYEGVDILVQPVITVDVIDESPKPRKAKRIPFMMFRRKHAQR